MASIFTNLSKEQLYFSNDSTELKGREPLEIHPMKSELPCFKNLTRTQQKKEKTRRLEDWKQWLPPVIPALWEVEIRRIPVLGQPGKKV
jgi:hypothetical protein